MPCCSKHPHGSLSFLTPECTALFSRWFLCELVLSSFVSARSTKSRMSMAHKDGDFWKLCTVGFSQEGMLVGILGR